ncbi:hypothetical protein GCM10022224_093480 [Nonomuraea antimicrobica]|uniref:Twin transmembrane helix small protein n=1 Tax=Nonomuraea antimicrobica TaxID=561173 RepID=A0ABP7E273_9ACTN
MNMPVLVDWLTLLLAPVIFAGLGLVVYARRRVAGEPGAKLPAWARVAQWLAVGSAFFIVFIRLVWGV